MMGRVIVVLACGWLLMAPAPLRAGERPLPSPATAPTAATSAGAALTQRDVGDDLPEGGGPASAGPAWQGYLGTLRRTVRLMIERTSPRPGETAVAQPFRPTPRRGDVGGERDRLTDKTAAGELDAPGNAPPTRLWFGPVAPNPSAGRVTFRVELPAAATVRIAIVDIGGRLVGEIREQRAAGRHLLAWSGERAWPAGVYLARLEVDGRPAGVRRMVVLR
jgi:hypothetical protein